MQDFFFENSTFLAERHYVVQLGRFEFVICHLSFVISVRGVHFMADDVNALLVFVDEVIISRSRLTLDAVALRCLRNMTNAR